MIFREHVGIKGKDLADKLVTRDDGQPTVGTQALLA